MSGSKDPLETAQERPVLREVVEGEDYLEQASNLLGGIKRLDDIMFLPKWALSNHADRFPIA